MRRLRRPLEDTPLRIDLPREPLGPLSLTRQARGSAPVPQMHRPLLSCRAMLNKHANRLSIRGSPPKTKSGIGEEATWRLGMRTCRRASAASDPQSQLT
jgi:hypothetical protein